MTAFGHVESEASFLEKIVFVALVPLEGGRPGIEIIRLSDIGRLLVASVVVGQQGRPDGDVHHPPTARTEIEIRPRIPKRLGLHVERHLGIHPPGAENTIDLHLFGEVVGNRYGGLRLVGVAVAVLPVTVPRHEELGRTFHGTVAQRRPESLQLTERPDFIHLRRRHIVIGVHGGSGEVGDADHPGVIERSGRYRNGSRLIPGFRRLIEEKTAFVMTVSVFVEDQDIEVVHATLVRRILCGAGLHAVVLGAEIQIDGHRHAFAHGVAAAVREKVVVGARDRGGRHGGGQQRRGESFQ